MAAGDESLIVSDNKCVDDDFTGIELYVSDEAVVPVLGTIFVNLYVYANGASVSGDKFSVSWSSSDTTVATVTGASFGCGVTGVSLGTSKITAIVELNGETYQESLAITVIKQGEKVVYLDVGELYFLEVECPDDDNLINWGFGYSDRNVAEQNGIKEEFYHDEGYKVYIFRIKGKGDGTAIFSCESYNTGEIYTCKFVVGTGGSGSGGGSDSGDSDSGGSSDSGGGSDGGGSSDSGGGSDSVTSQTMYRMYNPNSSEHFYTSSSAERAALIDFGWDFEGTGWTAPSTGTPVYRLYNPNAVTGSHHYTTSVIERNNLVNAGWYDEGIGWYSASASGTPLYRLYNPNSGDHHYTTSVRERSSLMIAGWNFEGIAWYGQ